MVPCSICLDDLKNPVATPCGHLHCDACLKAHVRSSPDSIQALCPTCRTSFPIVTPDLNLVPKKYHMFISPSVRRVYLEPSETEDLQNQVAQLEARIESLRRDKNMLIEKCESTIAKAAKHAEGEKAARLEAQTAQKEAHDTRKKYEVIKAKYQEIKNQKPSPSHPAVKRNSSQAALDISAANTSANASEWPQVSSNADRIEYVNNRPMLRIPKRPRIIRAPTESPPQSRVSPYMRDDAGRQRIPLFRAARDIDDVVQSDEDDEDDVIVFRDGVPFELSANRMYRPLPARLRG